jgi:transcriptional regulator with XRE-family HTH domain
MIGLEFIMETYNTNANRLAEDLQVSRHTIYDWLKGRRKIPAKRLKQLSEYFELPEEYFQKELSAHEKFDVQLMKLKREKEGIDETTIFPSSYQSSPILEGDIANLLERIKNVLLNSPEQEDHLYRLQIITDILEKSVTSDLFDLDLFLLKFEMRTEKESKLKHVKSLKKLFSDPYYKKKIQQHAKQAIKDMEKKPEVK